MQDKFFRELNQDQREKDRQIKNLETSESGNTEAVHATSYAVNTSIAAGATHQTGDLRDGTLVPTTAKGVFAVILLDITPTSDYTIRMSSGDDTPDVYSMSAVWSSAVGADRNNPTQFCMIPLGSDGTIKLACVSGGAPTPTIVLTIVGYWT